ncbi:MAG: hypothetical protein OXI78_06390 [Anaerolineaceae bacterium]|nr:hypothetical protein [Anaerolineaceae bacterium]
MSLQFDQVFSSVPDEIHERLKKHYREMKHNNALRKFEPSELNGGKICEDVFRVLEWHSSPTDTFTPYGTQIKNFKRSVSKFVNDTNLDDSVRFHIPDILCSIYNIRNKRGVGHTPGEIDPNFMDATLVAGCVDWIMAELVRLFHNISLDEARDMVKSMTTKKIPLIWEVGDVKRVLSPPSGSLSAKDKVLVLLYSETSNLLTASSLRQSIEYRNTTNFRNKVLIPLHNAELVHFDRTKDEIILSPKGIKKVEDEIPLEF